MATYQCPKGHQSTDPDYCSECGALIGPSTVARATPATPASAASAPGLEVCPDCSTPRTPGARFCEVCRHDFEAGSSSGQAQPAPAQPAVALASTNAASPNSAGRATTGVGDAPPMASTVADPAAAGGAVLSASAPRLNVIVVTDPSLVEDEEERKQCPQDAPELVFPLDLDENLVGRRSDPMKIYPEIDLNDPGVSHRHLKILRQPDGSFAVLELGSKNGTTLNGMPLKPGLVTPLAAGNELLLGSWTRLQLRQR